jgi:fucose 4-O-acetylase-like acetyltransferase
MSSDSAEVGARLGWIDSIRGVGIILMFYGHVLQLGYPPQNASAADQMRLIYSFDMPLFFTVAGFFFRPGDDVVTRLRQLAARRLVPVAFFGLLLLPLWLFGELRAHLPVGHDALFVVAAEYLRGRPYLDWVTWFLVCLFVCESLAMIFLRRVTGTIPLVLIGFACIFGGVYFSNASLLPSDGLAYVLGRTWFLSEAIVALGLYSIGRAVYPYARRLGDHPAVAGALFVGAAAIVLATYRHKPRAGMMVTLAARRHGDALRFTLTALAGTAAGLSLGVLFSGIGWLQALGRNTLCLLGLNGFFFHYVDPNLLRLWHVPDSGAMVLLYSLAVTIPSLLVCLPVVRFLNRYLPQLVGKSGVDGPWLPAIEPRTRDRRRDEPLSAGRVVASGRP